MTTEIGAQLRKGVVEFCILGLLEKESTYGWKLSEELITRDLIASIGTLYPVLGRLRERGFLVLNETSGGEPGEESGRPRKYYSLTAAGQQRLQEFRDQWHPFTATVSDAIGTKTIEPGATE